MNRYSSLCDDFYVNMTLGTEMELPANTLPMMTGFGQFGPLEMGGMFSVLKVREGLAALRSPASGFSPSASAPA